jgi:hypothetical protein
MGRTGHPALFIGVCALAVLAAGASVALTRGDGPVAHARTTLGPVRGAQIISANGAARPATAGAVLAPGDVVTTSRHGNAQLLTRGRITMLTGDAALEVVDGARQQLRTGTAVVDAIEGPGLTLQLGNDTVTVPTGSAIEADRSLSVRVGALAGPAGVANGSGGHLSLPALWQAVINGDALPGAPTPLHLSDSPAVRAAEARAVPELVADDLAMQTLARGINTTGASTAHLVEASWNGRILPAAAGLSRSERVLPVAIAEATRSAGGTTQQRYDEVVGWRAEGGSWGVVVHLLKSRAAAVVDVLHSLQSALPNGSIGTVSAHSLSRPVISTSPGAGRPSDSDEPGGGSPTGSPPRHPVSRPHGGTGSPPPTPAALVGTVVNTLGDAVNKLLSVLPLSPPAQPPGNTKARPVSSPAPVTTATPTPTPAPTPPSLLGNLLGGLSPR